MEKRMLAAITEIITSFATDSHTLKSLSQLMLKHLLALTQSKMGLICGAFYDSSSGQLTEFPCHGALGLPCDSLKQVQHHVSSSIFSDCITQNQCVIDNHFDIESRKEVNASIPRDHVSIKSIAVIPLHFKGKLSGIIALADRHKGYSRKMLQQFNPLFAVTSNVLAAFDLTRQSLASKEAQVKMAKNLADAKDAFLAKISHEIRTPLNGIVGMTRVLLNENLPYDVMHKLNVINDCSFQLISQVDDLLDYSKMMCGKLVPCRQPFVVRQCVEKAIDIVAAKAAQKNLTLEIFVDSDVPYAVLGDESRLRQVLVNLLSNAVKFTPAGSVVVHVKMQADSLRFEVQDTGVGISEEDKQVIFNTFSQGSNTNYMVVKEGTGLGLAIAKKLVELMKGDIGVVSTLGEGATFWFTIQAQPVQQPPLSASRLQQQASKLQGLKTIVVDDNFLNTVILGKLLQEWNVSYVIFDSPKRALLYIQSGMTFDVGFIDIHMPNMSGFELARKIDTAVKTPFPLVALSSGEYTAEEKQSGCFQAYLSKPLKKDLLLYTLMQVTKQKPDQPLVKRTVVKQPAKPDLKILVAEDIESNQEVILSELQLLGYTNVTLVDNGLAAVNSQKKNRYDVILMDLVMPVMDGITATRRIRKDFPKGGRPLIVALTAMVGEVDKSKCTQAGMDNFLGKPVDLEKLEELLDVAS